MRLVIAAAVLLLAAAPTRAEVPEKVDALAAGRGEIVFSRFCATCHGTQGDGKGPLSGELRTSVPDLRLLAARNSGNFPFEKVLKSIDGRQRIGAHGPSDMPAWGDALKNTDGRGDGTVEQAVANLAHYVWSLQKGMR
jgi:mono/diheme cytochrome c family protein